MRTLLTQPFTFHDMATLRRAVSERAEASGLSGPRLDDFVLAVHESVVNVVEHAGGHGYFRLWAVDGVIRAETTDRGPGIPDGYARGHRRPSDQITTGRGIYLIRRLCDAVDLRTGPGGTTVRLTMRLPRRLNGDGRMTMRWIRVTAGGGRSLGGFTA